MIDPTDLHIKSLIVAATLILATIAVFYLIGDTVVLYLFKSYLGAMR